MPISILDNFHFKTMSFYNFSNMNFVTLDPEYLGCYMLGDRAILSVRHPFTFESPAACIIFCTSGSSFFYAGIQQPSQCHCGREGDKYNLYGLAPDNDCAACPDDGAYRCGGGNRMAIYKGRHRRTGPFPVWGHNIF